MRFLCGEYIFTFRKTATRFTTSVPKFFCDWYLGQFTRSKITTLLMEVAVYSEIVHVNFVVIITTAVTMNFSVLSSRAVFRCMLCLFRPWLTEFNGVVQSCFTLSRSTVFTEVSPMKPEDSPIPLFTAILHSVPWVKKIVNTETAAIIVISIIIIVIKLLSSYYIVMIAVVILVIAANHHQQQHRCRRRYCLLVVKPIDFRYSCYTELFIFLCPSQLFRPMQRRPKYKMNKSEKSLHTCGGCFDTKNISIST